MTDNDLINLLATQLEAASASAGFMYPVIQKQQPTQQGIQTDPVIYFEHLFDRAFGYPIVSDQFNSTSQVMTETETQLVETTFQISSWVIQDPNNLALPTASDVVQFMRGFLMSRFSLRTFLAQNVGLLRVSEVRNPYVEEDRSLIEAVPSFDIVLTHSRSVSNVVDFASTMIGQDIVVQ